MRISFCALLLSWSLLQAEQDSPAEQGWVSLFDGQTLQGWTTAKGEPLEEGKWVAEDGVLTRKAQGAGEIFSEKEYGDFEFSFEWKISKNGNSGVKYRVAAYGSQFLGLEYQILDDEGHPDSKKLNHQTAALYDLKVAAADKPMNAVGEWNRSRILVREGKVQHYLNDALVMEIEIPSEDWNERFLKSKYARNKGFGTNSRGRLLLQDHGDEVFFRNLRIREF